MIFPVALLIFNFFTAFCQNTTQIRVSGSNLFRYGHGNEHLFNEEIKKEYFENITDAKLSINNFALGLRLEYIDPAEIGRNFKGLRKRYIEYRTDDFEIRAGTFSEIVGRGLALNSFEQRELAFDTGLDGIRIIYQKTFSKNKNFRLRSEILGGFLEYSDYLEPERIEKYDIRNINLEGTLFSLFSLGVNYVYADGIIPTGNTTTDIEAYLPEIFLTFNSSRIQLLSSYAHKNVNVKANSIYPSDFYSLGDGFYLSGNYSVSGLGLTFEYKNYRFDLTTPDNQSTERATKVLPFQNPPTVLKQQTSVLTSRISHPVDFNDDVGVQLELSIVPDNRISFLLNASLSSKHFSFYDADTSSKIHFVSTERTTDFLPSFSEGYSPNIELSAETEYEISENLNSKLGIFYQRKINYNYFFNELSERIHYLTIPADVRYNLSRLISARIHSEVQHTRTSYGTRISSSFLNYYFSVGINRSPDFSININSEFTTNNSEPTGKKTWVEAEISWKLTATNIVVLAYGSERGGLRCSGGTCKYINPFNGLRISIQSIFD